MKILDEFFFFFIFSIVISVFAYNAGRHQTVEKIQSRMMCVCEEGRPCYPQYLD